MEIGSVAKPVASFGLIILATFSCATAAFAWQPKGPIKLLIGPRAGGGADTQARLIAEAITKAKGWKIIPQNVPGVGGIPIARRLKNEPKDGLSIGMLVSETFTYNVLATKNPGFKPDDFTMLTTTAGSQMGLIARADSGWQTLHDVIAAGKKGAIFKTGSMSPRLADGLYLLGKANGVKFNNVMMKGGKGVLNAVMGKDVDFGWAAGIQTRSVKSGDIINLASGETTKLKISPNAPLLKDFGLPYDFGVNFMFAAPAGIPKDARKAISEAIGSVVKDPKSKANKLINRAFGGPKVISGTALEKLIKNGIAQSRKLLAASDG